MLSRMPGLPYNKIKQKDYPFRRLSYNGSVYT
jgi:hypothetical protein